MASNSFSSPHDVDALDTLGSKTIERLSHELLDQELSFFGMPSRLDTVGRARYRTIEPESALKLWQNLSKDWDKYKAALEKDYSSGHHGK